MKNDDPDGFPIAIGGFAAAKLRARHDFQGRPRLPENDWHHSRC